MHFRNLAKHFKLRTELDSPTEKLAINLTIENWSLTHHAFLYPLTAGKGWAFDDAIFSRRLSSDEADSSDVTDPPIMREIAMQVEIDAGKAINASSSDLFDQHHAALVRSGEADGVFGVPFFAIEHPLKSASHHTDDFPYVSEVFSGNDHLGFLLNALTETPDRNPANANAYCDRSRDRLVPEALAL